VCVCVCVCVYENAIKVQKYCDNNIIIIGIISVVKSSQVPHE